MTRNRFSTSALSSTADGSSITMSLASWDSALAMLTTCLPAADSVPTSRVGRMSGWPSRVSSVRAASFVAPRRVKPSVAGSCPRKMFSATDSPSTRSSSW